MISKFNLYDLIANIIPGLTFLWLLEQLSILAGFTFPVPLSGQLTETSVLIALSYATGLILQGIGERITEKQILQRLWKGMPSERWLLPQDGRFSSSYKSRVFELIEKRFGVVSIPDLRDGCTKEEGNSLRRAKNRELFMLCYSFVDNHSTRPQIFNAQYGLFRGMLTLFGLSLCLSIGLAIWKWVDIPLKHNILLLLPGFLAAVLWITYQRCKKRAEDFAECVYDLFIIGATDNLNT
jgi:hypothetical protein